MFALYLDSFASFCRVYLSASFFCISPSFSRFPTHSSPLYRFFLLSLYTFVHLHLFTPYLFISSCYFLFLPYSASCSSLCPRLTDGSSLSTSYPRLHRTIALSALGEGAFWHLLGQSFLGRHSKPRMYELPVIVIRSAVCLANVHRSELQIETSLLWKWITHFPQKLPACIHTNTVLQCAV